MRKAIGPVLSIGIVAKTYPCVHIMSILRYLKNPQSMGHLYLKYCNVMLMHNVQIFNKVRDVPSTNKQTNPEQQSDEYNSVVVLMN